MEHDSDRTVKIKLSGKLDYEEDITLFQAAQIIGFLGDESGAAIGNQSAGARSRVGVDGRGTKITGPRAALDASGAKTNSQKIVALAHYVLKDGGETFKLDAVKVQFQRARETTPKNLSRDLNAAIASGWIEESAEIPGDFYLTQKANQALLDSFEKAESPNGSGRRSRSSSSRSQKNNSTPKRGKRTKPDVFAAIDAFPATMDGFPDYPKMSSNKERLLWAVRCAKEHNINGLSNQDIAWLTDHLGHGIPAGQVTAAFDSARKSGYANRSTTENTIRIVQNGEKFLAELGKSV